MFIVLGEEDILVKYCSDIACAVNNTLRSISLSFLSYKKIGIYALLHIFNTAFLSVLESAI